MGGKHSKGTGRKGKTKKSKQKQAKNAVSPSIVQEPSIAQEHSNQPVPEVRTCTKSPLVLSQEEHEKQAAKIEELRKTRDYEAMEEEQYSEAEFTSLELPDVPTAEKMPTFTIVDVAEHNAEFGEKDWFKYGKRVYSWGKMWPIIQERKAQFANSYLSWSVHRARKLTMYPVYFARDHGVTRKEMRNLLCACQVGNFVEISRDVYLKETHDGIQALMKARIRIVYKNQFRRWLDGYRNFNENRGPQNGPIDLNTVIFPLPAEIMQDSTVLRNWIRDWKPFDFSMDERDIESDVFPVEEDPHMLFADLVASRTDNALADFDTSITGEAGWDLISMDLLKHDTVTPEQEAIWKFRGQRKSANDDARMRRRRAELAERFCKLYRYSEDRINTFVQCCDVLEDHWEEFQRLVSSERGEIGETTKF